MIDLAQDWHTGASTCLPYPVNFYAIILSNFLDNTFFVIPLLVSRVAYHTVVRRSGNPQG